MAKAVTTGRNAIVIAAVLLVDGLVLWGIAVEGYRAAANLMPAAVAVAVTLLCIPIVWRGRREGREDEPGAGTLVVSGSGLVWLVALAPVVFLLGFRLGLPIYAFVYAVGHGIRLAKATVLAMVVASTIEGLFVYALGVLLPTGWLIDLSM